MIYTWNHCRGRKRLCINGKFFKYVCLMALVFLLPGMTQAISSPLAEKNSDNMSERRVLDVSSNLPGDITDKNANTCYACSSRPSPPKREHIAASATGYCPSYGGSHNYEYISNVDQKQNPDKTMAITVNIYIANPSGCTSGNLCPEYDGSPEYVNVWIDWNGDKDFDDPGEKVMDIALTGYLGINYMGTMTTSKIVTIPSNSVSSTWMRTNLGWGFDPNSPCDSSWAWGDVVDKKVQIQLIEPPKIDDVIISPTNPTTLSEVKFEAKLKNVAGFEVSTPVWSMFDIAGSNSVNFEGNPGTYNPASGTFGNKKVACTINYKNMITGERGFDVMFKPFKLFFKKADYFTFSLPVIGVIYKTQKWANDDGSDEVNWFQYWKNHVPGLSECKYNPKEPDYGGYSPNTDGISLGDAAVKINYDTNLGILGDVGDTGLGIDCLYQTVAHERKHKEIRHNKIDDNGVWKYWADKDKDGLPNDYEDAYIYNSNKFDKNNSDTYDIYSNFPTSNYKSYGDQEVLARIEETGKNVDKENDWASPGKQTNPKYDGSSEILTKKTYVYRMTAGLAVSGSEIINITEQGVDEDGDGKYNYLLGSINFTSDTARNAQFIARLMEASGDEISTVHIYSQVVVGYQRAYIIFRGVDIRNSGKNGPYILNVSYYTVDRDAVLLDSKQIATRPYSCDEFQPKDATFNKVYLDKSVDANNDGIYDNLVIGVGANALVAGTYSIEGYLYDGNNKSIAFANNTTYLVPGVNVVELNFSGSDLANSKISGSYQLKYLTLYGKNRIKIDFIYHAYDTAVYSYTKFVSANALFSGAYSDVGADTNGDGYLEYLKLNVGVNVTKRGNYTIEGILYDDYGNETTDTRNTTYLDSGVQNVILRFDGKTIYTHGVNGVFNLTLSYYGFFVDGS